MSSHLYSGYTFDQLFPLIRATLDAGIAARLSRYWQIHASYGAGKGNE